jgi:archaeal cell division control protein 6
MCGSILHVQYLGMVNLSKPDTKIYDYVDENSNIVVRADVLSPDYVPTQPVGRIDQIAEVAALSQNLFLRGAPKNTLVFGGTGTGKTTIVKYALGSLDEKLHGMVEERDVLRAKEEKGTLLEAETARLSELDLKIPISNVKWVYVLCKKHKTPSAILHKLITTLDPSTTLQRTGVASDIYFDELYRLQKRQNMSLIIVLDEIDYILHNEQSDDILYNFTRAIANSELEGQFISIWGLSNSIKFEGKLDERIISSALFEKLFFPSYDTNELYHILKARTEIALIPAAIADDVLLKCALGACENGGDARKAINVLMVAAELTNKLRRRTITIEAIREAEDKVMASEVVKSVMQLKRKHMLVLLAILRILKYRKSATTGMVAKVFNLLIQKYNELYPDSPLENRDRYFTKRVINTLDTMEIVTTEVISQGRAKGRTTYIYVEELDVPVILKCIYNDYYLVDLEGYDPLIDNQGIIIEEPKRKQKQQKLMYGE